MLFMGRSNRAVVQFLFLCPGIAEAANRGFDPRYSKALGVADRHALNAPIGVAGQLAIVPAGVQYGPVCTQSVR